MNFDTDNIEAATAGVAASIAQIVTTYAFSVLGAIIILIIGFFIAGWIKRAVYRLVSHRGETTLAKFLANVARYTVLTLVLVMVLQQFGIQTASIIAALGAAGLAIGLALQGTLQNIAAGVMLLFLRPFKIGDFIDTGSVSGTVEEIGLFATELKTLDGLYVLAPNSSVWGNEITNFSYHNKRRFDLVVGIGYDDDIDLAMQTMRELVEGDERVLTDPAPFIYVNNLGDSAVEIVTRIWMPSADWWVASRELIKRAKQACDAKGINIPFPQRDVHFYPTDGAQPVEIRGKGEAGADGPITTGAGSN
ncbi:mechanosensitive ion channel family protein [Pseudohoeflea coraliihabitans]|uniref:Small-conductance mechanosensitive channel n=1 Tax=Pseudohoeflea coraliihabitans TaxID=2860393 RepID=A0ABS6WJ49_9HYPH|nr:mechanosensitive ion channel family protein [Pseudohoeflea sp. DP4N28-3]MBW3095959.1 mechanosensitive ion channel family protein [Pseudohoeflea sp. DP4N28-3]